MKKCPSCYAIMRESITPTQVPELQRKFSDEHCRSLRRPGFEMSAANVVTRKNCLPNPLRLLKVGNALLRSTADLVKCTYDDCSNLVCPATAADMAVAVEVAGTRETYSATVACGAPRPGRVWLGRPGHFPIPCF